ncbi:lysine--tRNA ligase [Candidatus Bathyarchaeota archaeon ex4484_135]|nr:MAG: lysine--tRNA ligase [Candidatus Bathyarchaeota archaeon ex4484_135]
MGARKEIIGRGTWVDKVAKAILDREARLGRRLPVLRTEMGIGASGIPHLGSFSDAARAHAVKLALEGLSGRRAEMIAYADDMDGLRSIPAGIPLGPEWLGHPVCRIPDPWKCHESFSEHVETLLLEAMDACGLEYTFIPAHRAYKEGLLVEQIRTVLTRASEVGQIVADTTGSEKYLEALPYFAVCENCGRIYTTRAYAFDPKTDRVSYKCEGVEVKGRWLEGCGHEGEADIKTDDGKLAWVAGEFAARWAALKICFEAYGKDIETSVRSNDRICREILGFEPPYHVRYELFLDKSGRKISKSKGNVLTPQMWLKYGPPQSLMLLMLKRFVGTRKLDISDVPKYVDELDRLEQVYFGLKEVEDEFERAKLRGLYEYVWNLRPPREPMGVYVPYNLLAYLASIAPEGSEEEYVLSCLRAYGYLKKGQPVPERLVQKVRYAIRWARDFGVQAVEREAERVEMTEAERKAVLALAEFLSVERPGQEVQDAIFEIARSHGIRPADFFRLLYRILLGMPKGPRLGPYIARIGCRKVSELLKAAVDREQK